MTNQYCCTVMHVFFYQKLDFISTRNNTVYHAYIEKVLNLKPTILSFLYCSTYSISASPTNNTCNRSKLSIIRSLISLQSDKKLNELEIDYHVTVSLSLTLLNSMIVFHEEAKMDVRKEEFDGQSCSQATNKRQCVKYRGYTHCQNVVVT